jgi:hypothetical protein
MLRVRYILLFTMISQPEIIYPRSNVWTYEELLRMNPHIGKLYMTPSPPATLKT